MQKASKRFKEIVKVFSRYGLKYILYNNNKNNNKLPENLRKAFEELGPTFIKIGQILSTRPDLLPEKYIKELAKLQDSIPEEPFDIMKDVFKESINKCIYEVFESIDEKPIASASISQVYFGILKDGREVVIKIQRPEIYEKMKMDISILTKMLKLTKNRVDISGIVDPLEVLEEIRFSI